MHIDQHMETEQTKQCQEFAPLSVIKEICVVPFLTVTFWGHGEMSLDYRHKKQCSLKPLLLFYRMFKVVLHFFPFYCVTASAGVSVAHFCITLAGVHAVLDVLTELCRQLRGSMPLRCPCLLHAQLPMASRR